MKFRLVHLSGSLTGRVRDIDAPEVVLGRDPRHCQVVFGPTDRGVSRRHAMLRVEDGILVVRDLESTGGTLLNGQSVTHARLAPGDVIQIGMDGPRLRLDLEEGAVMHTPLPDPGPGLDSGAGDAVGHRIRLAFISGSRKGEVVDLPGTVLRLGRAPGSSVLATDRVVSAQHAKIVRFDEGYVLIDLESRNGTFLNGHRVQRARLANGDVVTLGETGPELRVEIPEADGGGDTIEIPGFAELARRRRPAVKVREIAVPDTGLTIGRAADSGLRLDSPIVSLVHARVVRAGGRLELHDLESTNGTWVDGQRAAGATPLPAGSVAVVGPFELRVAQDGATLEVHDTRNRARLDARDVTVRAEGHALLHGINLSLPPGSFTALIGPSGSGKSTLLEALAGLRGVDAGEVAMDGRAVGGDERLQRLVGYVPQDDVVHPELTVERTLDHAARLRLPATIDGAERQRRVTEVLSLLELSEQRDTVVGSLSGGQRKRVSIAAELLTEPHFLFLDEPTSGLDPGLEESLMLLLKELSHKGRTVVLVTHTLAHVHLCDALGLLMEGRLVFYGSPAEAAATFGVDHVTDLYARLRERPADEWRAAFEASPQFREQVRSPLESPPTGAFVAAAPSPRPSSFLRQLLVQTTRYAEILVRDRRNVALLLAQAPVIAALVGVSLLQGGPAASTTRPLNTLLFLSALTAVWFGCSNAAREIVKERALHARERRAGGRELPYVLSKLIVLTGLAVVQCGSFLAVLGPWFQPPGPWPLLFPPLLACAVVGILLGLAVSAHAATPDRAMTLLPILLIPQVLFTAPAVHMDVRGPAGVVARAMPTWWGLDLLRRVALVDADSLPDATVEARLQDGSGRSVLLGRDRVERMLRDGYPMYQYRDRLETAWPAALPEKLGARVPGSPHLRAAAADAAVLGAFAIGLLALALALQRRPARGRWRPGASAG